MRSTVTTLLSASISAASLLALAGAGGCTTAPRTESARADIRENADRALETGRRADPSLGDFLSRAAGYAVFPTVGKGAVGVGGAYGKGILYQNGQQVGYCDLSQGSLGFQLGGQAYTQIIAFETSDAVSHFKSGNFAFAAQATAVALRSGAGTNAKYQNNVAVFTMDEAGLMFEASVGGQKFDYQPF